MGNIENKDSEFPGAYYSLYNNNYLINSYKCLLRSKLIHFFMTLIEILLNIIHELYIFLKKYNLEKKENIKYIKILSFFPNHIQNLSIIIRIVIVILYIIIFDSIYIFSGRIKLKKRNIFGKIIYNFFELLFFRISMLIFLNIFCSLSDIYYLLLLLLLIPHLYLIIYHLFYNHLYAFVPVFIEYPYDEFSSLFDFCLLVIKILLAIIQNTKNVSLMNFGYILILAMQIYWSIYFIYQLLNQSYLFMKNLFLNETKIALYIIQTLVIIIAELSSEHDIFNISFIIFLVCLFIIILLLIYLLYEPTIFMKIKRETPHENIVFYLFILSKDTMPLYIIENQINKHYESCGICDLCKKYVKYLKIKIEYIEMEDNENLKLIKNKFGKRNTNKLINMFFNILYDGKNKFFPLIKEIILTYRNNKKNLDINNSYFYINLSFLIFAELKLKNYLLALNIKIILDEINNINKLLDTHEIRIRQIILCNQFLTLCNSTLKQINNILKSETQKGKKFVELSSSLNDMKHPKYKEILFSYKSDDISNSKNTIFVCSLLYEEIFNTILTSNQIPLRENYQLLEDNFNNSSSKIEKIISLALNLSKKRCKILRVGKELYSYKDNDLFDLIPLIFKDYFVNDFIYKMLEQLNTNINEKQKRKSLEVFFDLNKSFNNNNQRKRTTASNKKMSLKPNVITQVKNKYIEFKMIISVNISSKFFYRLLILKLTPLFNYDYNINYILLDGTFYLYKNTIMTLQDTKNNEIHKKIISVSKLELETPPQIYTMNFQKYAYETEKKNFNLSKIFSFQINNKLVSIYSIYPKEKNNSKKLKESILSKNASMKSIEEKEMVNSKDIEKFIEDNASLQSQISASNINILSGLNIKNKKKENIYRSSNLYKIQHIYYLLIPIIILFSIIEILHLISLKQGDYNNDYSILSFNEFFKLYFQLFSSILSVVCIKHNNGCTNIMTIYSSKENGMDNYFNFSIFFQGQNQVLAKQILEKKNNLINIHQNIGNEKYKYIFEERIPYTRISKIFTNDDKIDLILMNVSVIFTEAILISINSFVFLTNDSSNNPIYFLNKRKEPFLYFDKYGKDAKNLTEYQKELYEMVLNYKIYYQQFSSIYYKLLDALSVQTQDIKIYNYFYFNASYAIILVIMILLYIYLINFEHLIVKILNYINKIINTKEEKFDFKEEFTKKIKNLEIILNIFEENPINAVNNLTSSYNKYSKYISTKNKNILSEKNKAKYKKLIVKENPENIFDDIPERLQIVKRNNIIKILNIYHYYLIFLIILCALVLTYVLLSLMWRKYYLIKDNLYSLLNKDTELEISFYKALSMYNLMFFDNLTLDELAQDIFFDPSKKINDGNSLINSFYDDLYISFNYNVEIAILVANFKNFPYFNFTCENLYEIEDDMMKEFELNSEIKKIGNIKQKILNACISSEIDSTNDMTESFQFHYRTIRNALITINDFSYEGLFNHLNGCLFGKIYLHFYLVLIYVMDIINVKFHKIEYDNLLELLEHYLTFSIVIMIILDIILIFIILFFYISRLKKFCEQIILLKKVFKICEIHEQ